MKTVPTAAHCTGWATPSNSSWKQPRETISCSSTFPCTLWCRQRRSASTVLTWQVTGPSKECMVKSQESYTITSLGYKAPAWMQVARRSSGQVQEFTVWKFKTQMPIQKRANRTDTGLWTWGRLTSRSWRVIHPLSVWGTTQAPFESSQGRKCCRSAGPRCSFLITWIRSILRYCFAHIKACSYSLKNSSFSESQNELGWKRPLRSLRPTYMS